MFSRYKGALWLGGMLLLSGLLAWCGHAGDALFARQREDANRASRAYYELLDGMGQIENDLMKLSVANTAGQSHPLLGRIAVQAQLAADHLEALPAGQEPRDETMTFVQQVGDLAASLLGTETLDDDQRRQLRTVTEACHALREKLLAQDLPEGDTDPRPFLQDEMTVEYPHLIYDGPFSEGHEDGESRGVENLPQASQEEMLTAARQYLRGPVSHLGAQADALACELFADGEGGTAAVTHKGGRLRWLLRDREPGEAVLSGGECARKAQEIAASMGFSPMAVSWVQEGVWLYPDMVKIKLARDNGELLALDATEYWAHHETRSLDLNTLSRSEITERLPDGFQCRELQRVLAQSHQEEKLLWQAHGTLDGAEYFILLDAKSGEGEDIFRVVQTDMGILVL